jgi:hypothetical protein
MNNAISAQCMKELYESNSLQIVAKFQKLMLNLVTTRLMLNEV